MYDSFSSDYDRFVNWPARLDIELPFLEALLQEAQPTDSSSPIRVLDAACGTGKHAIALTKKGYAISGADLSEGMIARARENSAAEGLEIPFAAAGFGGLERLYQPGSFDAVLCLGNSLPHLISRLEVEAALADFAALLRPGGMLLVQNRNFDAVMLGQERWMEPQGFRDADSDWVFVRFYDFQPDGLISFNILTLKREKIGEWKQSVSNQLLRPLLRVELVEAAAKAGFKSIQTFGGMDGSDFVPQKSGNLILTARKGE